MIDKDKIRAVLAKRNLVTKTDFDFRTSGAGEKLKGKVRDIYPSKKEMIFISTDRQSAFDRVIASVPFKGQVLNQASIFWFEKTKSIIPNHFLHSPDPNVMVGKKLTIFPVEFVVRGYLAGSTSTSILPSYQRGEREFCGHHLPDGLNPYEKLPQNIVTPTTKGETDVPTTATEVVDQGWMSEAHWKMAEKKALELFAFGQQYVEQFGLILVDTKYEFGLDERGNVCLADEIHTPDSSRFWLLEGYEQAVREKKSPKNIDKEFLRLWLKENSPNNDPYEAISKRQLPEIPEEKIVELSSRYIELFEKITGKAFDYREGPVLKTMEENIKNYLTSKTTS